MDALLPGTRSCQYTSIIKQVLNECVPINELLHDINDNTKESLSIHANEMRGKTKQMNNKNNNSKMNKKH